MALKWDDRVATPRKCNTQEPETTEFYPAVQRITGA